MSNICIRNENEERKIIKKKNGFVLNMERIMEEQEAKPGRPGSKTKVDPATGN